MSLTAEVLPLFALEALSPSEMAAVEATLVRRPELHAVVEELRATAAALIAVVPPIQPSSHLRTRLLASAGAGRFERFTAVVAELFDLPVERARVLLGWIDDPTRWTPAMPHFAAIHFAGGPACVGADTGFVRMAPRGVFPYHAHIGEERTLILAGSARTSDGISIAEGDQLVGVPGTAHDFVTTSEEDLIYATRAFGVRFGIVRPSPDEPAPDEVA
ncbi:MAG: hypothetical protein R3B48_15195 [Kofleriaceae bacterium]